MNTQHEEIIEYIYKNLKEKSNKITKEMVMEIFEKSPLQNMDFFQETVFLVTDNPYDFESEAKVAKDVKYPDDDGYLTVISQHTATLIGDFEPGELYKDYTQTNPEFSINNIQVVLVLCNSTTFKSDNIYEEIGGYYGNTIYVYIPKREYEVKMFSELIKQDNELSNLIKLDEELDLKIKQANELLMEVSNLEKR